MCVEALGCWGRLCVLMRKSELRSEISLLMMSSLRFGRTVLRYIGMECKRVTAHLRLPSHRVDCGQFVLWR